MNQKLRYIVTIPFVLLLFSMIVLAGLDVAPIEPVQAQGTVIYVDDDTCPDPGSGTQPDPYCQIQTAVTVASEGDEIRVAEGAYTGAQTVAFAPWGGDPYTYTQVVFITTSLTLRGGYSPGDWDTSDPTANPTVIDAERYGRGISIVGTGSQPVTVDGFIITGGDYTDLGNPIGTVNQVCRSGGGSDCGGGIYAYYSALVLRNSVITDNVASHNYDSGGGGIYLWEVPYGSLIENTIVISNSTFGNYSGGGGMYADRIHGPITITQSTFRDNYAEGRGGGMLLYDADALVTIVETDFLSNTAQAYEGGGAHIRLTEDGETLRMDRVRLQNNRAENRAAALFLHAAGNVIPQARLTNLLLSGNRTDSTTASDAVIGIDGASTSFDVSLAHVTAADNQAPTFLYAEPAYDPGDRVTVTLANTLVVSFTNGFAAEETGSGKVLIRHVNTLADDVAVLHQTVGGSPTFEAVNPLTGDPKLDGTYHLQPGSAAFDAGVDAGVVTDIEGDFRPQSIAPDIGADELVFDQAPTGVTITGPSTVVAQVSGEFIAEVSPITAALPITYVWEATGQSPVTHTNEDLSDTVNFTWPTTGAKMITVTASNAKDMASNTYIVDVTAHPSLVIGKSGPAEAIVGDSITYTLTVTNVGIATADSLVITDALPTGANYVGGGTLVGDNVQWAVPNLAANGGETQVSFVVTATQTITNAGYRVSASGGYSATGAAPVVTVVGVPDLSISKAGPYAEGVGEEVEYELTITNNGTIAANHLIITDALPIGAHYISGGVLVGDEVHWEVENLAGSGGVAQVSFVVTATETIVNDDYRVGADGGFGATGSVQAVTIIGTGTRYVTPGGADALNNCTDSNNPCATLQHAVNVANEGEEIRVAAGIFSGAQTVAFSLWGGDAYTYTQVVFIDKGLTLRGGYDPDDWDTSDPTANPTIIDAKRQGRGISIVDTGGQPVIVDGFTITGGDYTGLGNPAGTVNQVCRGSGGSDCGGGIYAYYGVLVLRNCIVTDNIAGRNDDSQGGGIYLWEVPSGSRIENTIVSGNSALGNYGRGGGMYADRINGPITITQSVFQDNYADGAGGGMLMYDVNALVTIVETDFLSNTAQTYEGGGAHIRLTKEGETLRMDRVRLQNNRAENRAAALFLHAAGPVIPQARLTNLLLSGNRTDSTTASDAVIGIDGASTSFDVSLAHVTAADNQAPTFLYAVPAGYVDDVLNVTLTNTLVVSFTNGFAAEEGENGEVLIRHTNTLTDDVAVLHHTVSGSPTFQNVNTLTGDPDLSATYHLQQSSAAINAGVDAGVMTDIDGQSRPYGDQPDIGADEYVPVAPASASISGPTEGFVGKSYAFSATVSPPTTTTPITYTWSPEPDEGQGTDKAIYRWTTPSTKTITVVAANFLDAAPPATHDIAIASYKIYLPLVSRN